MVTEKIEQRDYRAYVNVSDYFELRRWAKRFGVTAGEVRRAVASVGDRPEDVENYLEFTSLTAATALENEARLAR
jgi:hypothetical protein